MGGHNKEINSFTVSLQTGDSIMKEAMAVAVGVLIAPAAPTLALGLLTFIYDKSYLNMQMLVQLALLFYMYSLLSTVLFALPVAFVVRKLGFAGRLSAIVGGMAIAVLIVGWLDWTNLRRTSSATLLVRAIVHIGVLGVAGGTAGFVFWLIWRRNVTSTSQK